ncbi:uncharacterized protein M421DRAFT_148437 [Didymella exigua CBS 183.55]|uniref:Uncharacterized protein n=1 Tax=Didymella exigua CBS 183.55 TaxID=1150837 RepID=A0A6A5RJH8_9PLEO|nr:uncharacterized protein M421DRAFT_148437 [Didymella exigua CBS 183.55]KAF1928535.1 hypothetical protein M421DRAFT_148437 [Didymella exigua CBS 183.55]
MPPRPSTLLASSPPATEPPTSENPTLPLLGAAAPTHGTKRKRTAAAEHTTRPHTPAPRADTVRGRGNDPRLYTPWLLLPARQRAYMEKRGTGGVVPVVWSKNQSVRGGVGALLRLLRPAGDADEKGEQAEIVVVSAQAGGTVKLVGILDVARRVLGDQGDKEGETKGEDRGWCVYTVLSSVRVPRREDGDGDKHGDGDRHEDKHGDGDKDEAEAKGQTNTLPVLSVWISRTSIPGWKSVFGEDRLRVSGEDQSRVSGEDQSRVSGEDQSRVSTPRQSS